MAEQDDKQEMKFRLMIAEFQQKLANSDLALVDAKADYTLAQRVVQERDQTISQLQEENRQLQARLDLAETPPAETNQEFAKRRQAEAKAKLRPQNEPEAEVHEITSAK